MASDQLQGAEAHNQLVVIFAHHTVNTLDTVIADEQASACTSNDAHGHDVNPGCDLDPRISEPLHLGTDPSPGQSLVSLLDAYPNVVAYVTGHTHQNRITPFPRSDGTTWWQLNTSATADNPNQSRLIEIFDNHDGTLSIITTLLDNASDATAPAAGNASTFAANQLASIGRTFEYNDPQLGAGTGEGQPTDRNAELLLDDPRDGVPNPPGGGQASPTTGAPGTTSCKGKAATIVGTSDADTLTGTNGDDVIAAGAGADKVKGAGGDDLICGSGGNDRLRGGGGEDRLRGGGGDDRLSGGSGSDDLGGGAGKDDLGGGSGSDDCSGGSGHDRARKCEHGGG